MTEKQEMDSRIEEIKWDDKSIFVGLVNLDFGKYKNVSHYGFNAVCKEKLKRRDGICRRSSRLRRTLTL